MSRASQNLHPGQKSCGFVISANEHPNSTRALILSQPNNSIQKLINGLMVAQKSNYFLNCK
jgi:hypothetical protein